MRSKLLSGVAALALTAATVMVSAGPASARGWHGHGGFGLGGAIAAGVIGGAAIASYPYWGGGYGGGCWQVRPTYDAYGNFLGQQSVNVC